MRRNGAIMAIGLLAMGGLATLPSTAQQRTADADAAYDALPDTPGTGRYPAARFLDPRLPDHVIYRPAAPTSQKLGVVVWGNGGCSDDGASARQHLAEIASHGYVVIAPGRVLSGPGGPPRPAKRPPPGPLGIKTTTAAVAAGIDWALAENGRAGSPLFGRIDPQAIAVSGHSCGGLQALQIAADPRVKAVIIHNSGVFKDGGNPIRGMTIDKSALTRLHTPILYVMGGPRDIAWPNGNDDYDRIAAVPAVIASLDVGHGGTFRDRNGGSVAPIAVAWLEWQLRGDSAASRWFTGTDCRLCTDRSWTVRRKGVG